jgi:hypothetical protein
MWRPARRALAATMLLALPSCARGNELSMPSDHAAIERVMSASVFALPCTVAHHISGEERQK